MIIPHLHFCGDCNKAINLYEKAFNTKAETIVRNSDDKIAHAVISIHGQKIFLNDRFGNKSKSTGVAIHLIIMFKSTDELLAMRL